MRAAACARAHFACCVVLRVARVALCCVGRAGRARGAPLLLPGTLCGFSSRRVRPGGRRAQQHAAVSGAPAWRRALRPSALQLPRAPLLQGMPSQHAASKYDFVKVKVLLGGAAGGGGGGGGGDGGGGGGAARRAYVLSRYILARQLTAIAVPHETAVRVALALKKQLVDRGLLEVDQAMLEQVQRAATEGCFPRRSCLADWYLSQGFALGG